MNDIRIIKKYPNRRLYDTAISCYITLDDLKNLVLEQTIFQVVDARTGGDITNNTLLQIISELEDRSESSPIFTNTVLQQIIRFYGHKMQYLLRHYLDQSMQFFIDHQATLEQDVQQLMEDKSPVVQEIAERNLALWLSLQRQDLEKAAEKLLENIEDK